MALLNLHLMKILYTILLFTSLMGCVEDSQMQSVKMPSKIRLIEKGLLSIPIDSQTSFMPLVYGYSQSLNLLYLWNEYNQSLYFYDLDQKKQVHKVHIPLRTDLGINHVSVVQPHSMDCIFIYEIITLAPELHIFNANTQEVSSFTTLNMDGKPYPIDVRSKLHVDTHYGNVFIRTAIGQELTTKENAKSILSYNYKMQKEELLIAFPEDYREDRFKSGPGISFDFDKKGNILFALPFENEFLVLDSSTAEVKERIPKNSPLMKPYTPIGDNLRPVEVKFLKQRLSRWVHLAYDPYRDLSYHVGIIGQEMPDPLPDDLMAPVPRRETVNGDSVYFTMMVYDGDYNFLGEVQGDIVYPTVTPQGILQLKYERAPGESQDNLMFYVYDIERIEE